MVNAKTEAQTVGTAQAEYDKVLSERGYTKEAKELGTAILKQITSVGASTKIAEIHAQIAEAASQGDDAKLEALWKDLSQEKLNQKNTTDNFKTIRGSQKFETIVQAWGPEIRELACSVAVEVIKGTSKALQNATTGGDTNAMSAKTPSSKSEPSVKTDPSYWIITNTKTKKTAKMAKRRGPNPGPQLDKEAYELLGFEFNEDNKSLKNDFFTYKDASGKEVKSKDAKRSTIADAAELAFPDFTFEFFKAS